MDPILSALVDSTADGAPPAEPKPENKPPAAPPAPAPAAGDPKPAPAAVLKRRPRREPEPPPAPPPAPAPMPAPPAAPAPTPTDDFEAGLLDEEKEQLEMARDAERLLGEKYKGFEGRTKKFLKDHQEYLAKARERDPDAVFDETNAEYQAWLSKNTPVIPQRDIREMERKRITEEVEKRQDEKISEVYDETFRRDAEPKVKQRADDFFNKAVAELPETLTKAIKEEGVEKAKAKFPTEFRIANAILGQAAADVEEFYRLTTVNPRTGRPMKAYDPKNPTHAGLIEFVNTQCNAFKKSGGKALIKDGKRFVTREEYYTMPKEQRAGVWTFTDDQIVGMARIEAAKMVKLKIEEEHNRLKAEGWTRPAPAAEPAPAEQPPGAPPAPNPTPIPAKPASSEPDELHPHTRLLMGE
ncbi:MAG: hypothetical protein KIT44_13545 [Opitutaceae bacterium]|nr:hypothetical protein [Opitutaceae bacterium]